MKKILSIKGKKAFKEVFKKGRRYRFHGMEIIVLKIIGKKENSDKNFYKGTNLKKGLHAGIQISKKFGNAVKRNRFRRQIRAILNEIYTVRLNEFYIIIRPGNDFKKGNFIDLKNNITTLFKKAGIYI